MKVLVTGDRNWSDRPTLFAALDAIHGETPIELLIEGCASGADRMAGYHWIVIGEEGWAWSRHVEGAHFPADWRRYGRGAGQVRNRQMLEAGPDLVVAFHNDLANSRGTANMVRQARKAGLPVRLFTSEGEATNEA